MKFQEKLIKLKTILDSLESFIIAYSGGLDSTVLMHFAASLVNDTKMMAVSVLSEFTSNSDKESIKKYVHKKIVHLEIELSTLTNKDVKLNPMDRCYFCKKQVFAVIFDIAKSNNYKNVIDGTNSDDAFDYRPGAKALNELRVRSPLKEAGFGKKDFRKLAKSLKLDIHKKPSNSCLATRIPFGIEITIDSLKKIEKCEAFLHELGFSRLRVRDHEHIARIEIDPKDFKKLLKKKDIIISFFKTAGYIHIALDLEGYIMGKLNAEIRKDI